MFYNPGTARIWSLRTRPHVWQTALRLLAAFVPVIVVDRRQPSDIVQFEVDWLKRRGFLDKVYMVGSPENGETAEHSATRLTVVDEATLIASQWSHAGLSH